MAKIRRKTIEPAAREYLKYARENGIELSWNNYERMLPQDGFGRLGLSCADCAMGPCRISPFAREYARTVCGLDADELAYRSAMRLMGAGPENTRDFIASLLRRAEKICAVPAGAKDGSTRVGRGVLRADMINICCEGVPFDRVGALEAAAARAGDIAAAAGAGGFGISVVGRVCGKRPTVAGEGDVEFAIMTGLADGYVLGSGAVGLGRCAAAGYATAVLCAGLSDEDILRASADAFARRDPERVRADGECAELRLYGPDSLEKIAAGCDRIAVFAGGANIKLTVGEAVVETVRRLMARGVACFVFGGAAIECARAGLSENVYASGAFVSDIAGCAEICRKAAVVAMPEIGRGEDLARALYLGERGLKVVTATELPFEGSVALADEIHRRCEFCAREGYVGRVMEIVG